MGRFPSHERKDRIFIHVMPPKRFSPIISGEVLKRKRSDTNLLPPGKIKKLPKIKAPNMREESKYLKNVIFP